MEGVCECVESDYTHPLQSGSEVKSSQQNIFVAFGTFWEYISQYNAVIRLIKNPVYFLKHLDI